MKEMDVLQQETAVDSSPLLLASFRTFPKTRDARYRPRRDTHVYYSDECDDSCTESDDQVGSIYLFLFDK